MTTEVVSDPLLGPFAMMQWWQKQVQAFMPTNILNEPILPNGTFAGIVINEQNSSDPQTERHITNHVSYGKQIGWLVDAVDILIGIHAGKTPSRQDLAKLKQLQDLKQEIDGLKNEVTHARFERVKLDLNMLEKTDLVDCKKQIDALLAKPSK